MKFYKPNLLFNPFRKNKFYLIIFLFVGCFITGCDEIIAKDLSKENIILVSPSKGSILDTSKVVLWWESIDGTTNYEVQLVDNSFNNAASVLLDTILILNTISMQLPNGNYEWRVRAKNEAYNTIFSYSDFSIDTLSISK